MTSDMLTLESLLAPIDVKSFIKTDLGQHFTHISGHAGKFASLLTWESLNELLSLHDLDAGRLRLVKEGDTIPLDRYSRLRPGSGTTFRSHREVLVPEMIHELRHGVTLIINEVDQLHPPICRLAEHLEDTFHVPIRVNLYAGFRTSPGFELHADDHDVFILQILGQKEWRLYGETVRAPLNSLIKKDVPDLAPDYPPKWEGTLRDGDLLYIPRGCWHVATPCDQPTVHLTVGMQNVTGMTLMQWLLKRLAASEWIRVDIPRFASAEAKTAYIDQFQQQITSALSNPNLLKDFLRDLCLSESPRPNFCLPIPVNTSSPSREEIGTIVVIGPQRLARRITRKCDAVEVLHQGRVFDFPIETISLFDFFISHSLVDGSQFFERFGETFGNQELCEFLAELSQYGIIALRPATQREALTMYKTENSVLER